MTRTLSLVLSLALLVLTFSSVMARPVFDGSRPVEKQVSLLPISPAVNVDARADTLFLFGAPGSDAAFGAPGTDGRGFTFDTVGGSTDCGWVGVDKTTQPDTYWHLEDAQGLGHGTDMSAALPFDTGDTLNDYAMHCGRWGVCGWLSEDGYGNNWDQHLRLTCGDFETSAVLDLAWISDYEGDAWDNGQIFIETFASGIMTLEEIYANDIAHETTFRDTTFTVLATDYPVDSFGDFIIRFHSDGAWSDEDGLFATDTGAMWVDNIVVTKDETESWRDDFETGVLPSTVTPEFPTGAGDKAELYSNLYTQDVCSLNMSFAWGFFDLGTTNPNYPISVIQYGPPYMDNDIQSPLLTMAHSVDDPNGTPMSMGVDTQVNLDFWVYADIPADPLIRYSWSLAAFTEELGCMSVWKNDNFVYYGDNLQWGIHHEDQAATLAVQESAQGGTVSGIKVALNCVDMCPFWCDTQGSGENHTPGPFIDVVRLSLVEASSVAWTVLALNRLQDNFPEASADGHGGAAGKVRMDPASNVEQISSPIVVVGDSTLVELNMDGHGGIRESFSTAAGEIRPEFWLYFQIVAGPHAGMLNASMGDPNGSDGCYSPYEGTMPDADSGLPDWGIIRADYGRYQGTPQPSKYAFDFADNYFEPGDIVHYFYRAVADDGFSENRPQWSQSSTPALRAPYIQRCLPTTGAQLLVCDDGGGVLPWWQEGLSYNGYAGYDTYTTLASGSGQENGLAGRAVESDIAQYNCIIWDSGNQQNFLVCSIGGDDKTEDDLLLTRYLTNATHQVGLWLFGDLVANDLGEGSGFLANILAAELVSPSTYYHDVSGIVVPKVKAVDPALSYLGGPPEFWVDGGCPSIENFSLINVSPTATMASVSHDWEVQVASEVAGIKNLDPDGNGEDTNEQGQSNPVVYHPYSYYQVWDSGYASSANIDYGRKQVGDVLELLLNCSSNAAPDAVPDTPAYTRLDGNFPNPFNPTTTVSFSLSQGEHVNLSVYDISGRLVKELVDTSMKAGSHEIIWDGKSDDGVKAASGVYFYKLDAGTYSATDKMVMLK